MKILKNTLALLIVAIVFVQLSVIAQVANYKHPVSIDNKGIIKKDGIKVGYISKKNTLYDAKGKKIAYMDGQGNLVDAKGKKMGRMGKDGKTFENVNGDLLLSVKDNGTTCDVFDSEGKKIGNIHSSYKGMACVLYCFQNDMDMKDHEKMTGDAKFACPMHPEVTGKDGDKCQKCGMKLTKASKK